MKIRLRFPWHLAVALACLLCLGLSVTSLGDTYNFYFKQKKQKQDVEEEEETQVQQPATPPPSSPPPIVINNTNNNNVGDGGQTISSSPLASPASPVAPASAAPAPPSESSAASSTAVAVGPNANPWVFGLSGMMLFQDFDYSYKSSSGIEQIYPSRQATWGGLVSLGYHFSPATKLNFYGGGRYSKPNSRFSPHLGADFEWIPFRLGFTEKWNLLELGFIAGGSTAFAADGNVGSFHGGARANFNLGPDFGITASTRANLGYIMLEAGITARL